MDKKKGLIGLSLAFLIMIIPIVSANEVTIILKDPEEKILANTQILYELAEGSGQATTDSTGSITLPESSTYKIFFDDSNTPGYDLYAKTTLSQNNILTMHAVGSIRIIIVDANNRPINDALVRIDCNNNYGEQGYFYSDKFGVVYAKFLPESSCTIKSAFKDSIKTQTIDVMQGDNREITLMFSDYEQQGNNAWVIIPVIIFIVILYAAIYFSKHMKKKKAKDVEINKEKVIHSTGKEDIITALDRKEKDVIRFLIKELSDKDSINQSKIVYGLGMAKTSLTRVLMNLETKNLIKIDRIGKLKKISLTEWFKKK